MEADVVLYTVADSRFFPGLVALVNSLRLQGHGEPVVVLDCGLTLQQKRRLAGQCRLVPFDRSQATSPAMFKPFAYLLQPRGVVAVVDSDVIVTGRLSEVFERARQGRICAAPDPEEGRWFPEWADLFGLRSPLRRGRYVNSGFVVFSVERWPDLLGRWWEACRRIWSHAWLYDPGAQEGPSLQADQDALNAILMSEVPPDALWCLPREMAPIGDQARCVQVVDVESLRCRCRGKPVAFLQSVGACKPWDRPYWKRLRGEAYVVLLRRLLVGPGLAVRVDPGELPVWLRPGFVGSAAWRVLVSANRSPLRPWAGQLVRQLRGMARGVESGGGQPAVGIRTRAVDERLAE